MPISKDRSVLFIHIPKNAGKSVELALEVYQNHDEEVRSWRSLPNRAATFVQRWTANKKALANLCGIIDLSITAQHLTYSEIVLLGLIERRELERLVKLAICRNPYDRAVSTFRQMGQNYENTSSGFEKFWREWPESGGLSHPALAQLRNQWEFCVDLTGKNAMNSIVRYENLEQEFADFCLPIFKRKLPLAWEGPSIRGAYQDYYNQNSRSLIKERFSMDFDFFCYSDKL